MANYIIIGGDSKEYGPVTDSDVRQWIAEGRLNAASLMKSEGDAEFRALGLFPEFADAFAQPANAPIVSSPEAGDGMRETALQLVKAPAVALQVVAGIDILLSVWSAVRLTFFRAGIEDQLAKYPQLQDPSIQKLMHEIYGPVGVASNLFALLVAVVIFLGARQMQKLSSYGFAITAAILALIPCITACCLIGLPFGIWALVVLNKTEVKSQFP